MFLYGARVASVNSTAIDADEIYYLNTMPCECQDAILKLDTTVSIHFFTRLILACGCVCSKNLPKAPVSFTVSVSLSLPVCLTRVTTKKFKTAEGGLLTWNMEEVGSSKYQ
jgi:hypothetical protein